ncbi:MAG TPA: serine hydrolase domain-containing protein [Aggregatilineales bacterium]|nr:serine hydrolase domain-containing protein [Aggregatilineales bacterium]
MNVARVLRQWRIRHHLDALLQAYVDQGRFNGAVLVAQRGNVLLRKGYGAANRETGAPFTPQTPSRIGSMTKAFTALAVLQQVEQGNMNLQDTIQPYFPDYAPSVQVTLHHLLSNTSGIPDYVAMPAYAARMTQAMTLPEILALFRDLPLQFEPGTDFGYSNSNWVLLDGILEQVTGKAYARVIREQIFDAAGMTRSGYDWADAQRLDGAAGIINTGEVLIDSEFVHESTMHGAGGLYSTVDDLYRWSQALVKGRLISPQTLHRMSQPFTGTTERGYGYGLELHSPFAHASIGHSGGIPGYVANYAHFPTDDVTIIILSNLGSAAWEAIHAGVVAILYGQPYAKPGQREFVSVEVALLKDYAGDYDLTFMGRRYVTRFSVEGDRLTMAISGLPKAVLAPLASNRFFGHSKGEVEITFQRDPAGSVYQADFKWGEYDLHAPRIQALS